MSTPLNHMGKNENEESTFEENRKALLLKLFMIAGGPICFYAGIAHIVNKNYLEGFFDLVIGVSAIAWFITLRWKKNSSIIRLASIYFMFLLGWLFLYFISMGGPGNCKALWSYVYPLLLFFLFGKREGMIWMSIFFLMTVALLSIPDFYLMKSVYNPDFKLRFLISLGLVSIMAFIFEVAREVAQARMLTNQELLKKSESRYRNAYEKLNEAQAQLIQSGKLASIGELASGVAHELNQPLMVIRGTAQLIRRSVLKNNLNNDELVEQLEPILRNTKRMMNIINHLRTFSRQSKGKFSRLDMNEVVKGSFTLINEQLRLHNIEVIEAYASDLPPVQGDENQLEQVIINLIANARDAMDKREEDSEADDKTKKILKISTSKARDNSHLEIRVTDSGEGIPQGDLDRIFDPFFTTKEVGKGTGLGLSISYGIIKDHQGEIEAVETSPTGTTFRIRLPIDDLILHIEGIKKKTR